MCENVYPYMMKKHVFTLVWVMLSVGFLGQTVAASARESIPMDFKVEGVDRQALVFPVNHGKSARVDSAPLVFCFHGHGGSARQASLSFRIHEQWPEAIVVYPQGLPTPGQLTDAGGKRTGWQSNLGDQGDRDFRFFDVMLRELSIALQIDSKRVYVMGHSNGGGFTYLLWAYRGDRIAAVAPCAALSMRVARDLKPKPCLHIAGKEDSLVKFSWQERMMSSVKRTNQCQNIGEAWAKDCLLYKPVDEKVGAPMVQFIHGGAHRYPDEATPLIVRFFKGIQAH